MSSRSAALPSSVAAAIRRRFASAAAVARRIIGAPDYDRYVAHMRAHHPGEPLLTAEDFAQQCMQDRYNRPGSRCC